MNYALINQPCGLGDILFTIKIGNYFASKGFRVIWPVIPTYECLKNRIKTKGIEFYSVEENFPFKQVFSKLEYRGEYNIIDLEDIKYIPIREANSFAVSQSMFIESVEKTNMYSKYAMCGLDPSNWQDCFSIDRNKEKENVLYEKICISKNYHLVNNRFGSPPYWEEFLSKKINTSENLQRVEMNLEHGYNIFDWIKIIENASKIDTVATSIPFILDKLDLKCNPTIHTRNKSGQEASDNIKLMKELYEKDYHYEI